MDTTDDLTDDQMRLLQWIDAHPTGSLTLGVEAFDTFHRFVPGRVQPSPKYFSLRKGRRARGQGGDRISRSHGVHSSDGSCVQVGIWV